MERKGMVGGIVLGVILLMGFIMLVSCIEKIPVGYQGIVYSMQGGVQNETLEQGWHIISPTKKVKLFAISNDQLLLTKDSRENSEEDESFKVATSDNANIAISFQMTYKFDEATLVDTYKTFKMDGDGIINNRVKTVLKSRVSEITTTHSMMDLYSGNRAEINTELTNYLNDKFHSQYGLVVLDASIVDVHPDAQLQEAIDNRVQAQQKADQAKAEQQTAKVEAETAKIKAQNEADIKVIEAQADADAILAKAEAEAKANKTLSSSITDELIRMKEAEARLEHGWVTVEGANAVIAEDKK